MHKSEKPSILIVDDEPDTLRDAVALGLGERPMESVVHPHDVEMSHLENADLVLVDYRLENWAERAAQSVISLQPATGMALAAVLREHVDRSGKDRLTAFALHSGHLGDVQGRLSATTAQHVLARLNNLEWAFPKTEPRRYEQMIILANAVRQLPRTWPNGPEGSEAEVRHLLEMDENVSSFDRCWRDVLECRAPVNDLTEGAHGILFVRWLLHQVMPYPCFLWGEHWVAARLRISVASLRAVERADSRLAEDLRSMRYSGILAGFLGRRWWRGALEDYIWELAGGHATDGERLREALAEHARAELEAIEPNPAVVCMDSDLQPQERFFSPTTAVPLRPDHWPAFADSAWMDIKDVRADPGLQSMVEPLDRYRVAENKE